MSVIVVVSKFSYPKLKVLVRVILNQNQLIGLKKKPKALAIVGLILGLLEVIIPVFILLALLFIIDQVN